MSQKIQTFSTRRLEGLSDGVFAFAMTLLILDLTTDNLGVINSSQDLLNALGTLDTKIICFLVSFCVLGSMWAVHVRQFEYIKRADRHLTMINTFRLLAVVIMPFTTSLAGLYPDIVLARLMFAANFLLLAAITLWQWRYAVRPGSTLAEGLSDTDKINSQIRQDVVVGIALIVLISSVVLGEWAFLFFFLMGPLMILFQRRSAKNKQKTQR